MENITLILLFVVVVVVVVHGHRFTLLDPHAFHDKHQHVMSPLGTVMGLTGVAVLHMRDHALSRTPQPDLVDILAQTPRSPIMEVIDKFKIKQKRSIGYTDQPKQYIYKSPILLKKPSSGAQSSSDDSQDYCDARDLHLESIGEHSASPTNEQSNGKITEFNEEALEINQANSRVRRSKETPDNQRKQTQQAFGCSALNCPYQKLSERVCLHGSCSKSQ